MVPPGPPPGPRGSFGAAPEALGAAAPHPAPAPQGGPVSAAAAGRKSLGNGQKDGEKSPKNENSPGRLGDSCLLKHHSFSRRKMEPWRF